MNTPDQNDNSDQILYALTICFAVCLVVKKFGDQIPIIVHWMQAHLWIASLIASGIGIILAALGCAAYGVLSDKKKMRQYIELLTADKPGSIYAGRAENGDRVFIPLEARKMHTQIVGTTNAGKSESVIIPWAVGDIRDKRGFVIVDGKADKSFINKIFAYSKHFRRTDDFKVFSLQDPNRSHTFNPLLGGSPEEVAERVFNSFEFDNSYYESVQYEVFAQVLRIFDKVKLAPTFLRIYQAIKNPTALHKLAADGGDETLESWAASFKSQSPSDREEKTSGLLAAVGHFAFGSHAKLFNTDTPDIDLREALNENKLIYFQLPVLKAAFLGKATGKLVLQCMQSAVADRHEHGDRSHTFFSIYLDDFTEYLYAGFVSLLNKSRSANVGVVFAHQSQGDIKALGEDVADTIFTNSNLKIIMRGNDPESAEKFAKMIGTQEAEQVTERAEQGVFGQNKTGQGSIRSVEEFIVHPNVIKRNLGVGEALVVIPHKYGSKTIKLKFRMVPDIGREILPAPMGKPVLGLSLKLDSSVDQRSVSAEILRNQVTPQKEAA